MQEAPETVQQFEDRKRDHIDLSLDDRNEAVGLTGFDAVHLQHEALPEINFSEIDIKTSSLGVLTGTPFLISSMTAGHGGSIALNILLAEACEARGWRMGVGSQRRELNDDSARKEWAEVRKKAPHVPLYANIGLSQIINLPVDKVRAIIDVLQGSGLIIHLNALQEVVQPEGTPNFRGGLGAIARLVKELPCPVVVKETGCGFNQKTLTQLSEVGVAAIDVSGFGGTHWGRIEGGRHQKGSCHQKLAETFSHWGNSTVQSLLNAQKSISADCEIWASGGVRNGLHAAKAIALGATTIGLAKPILKAALDGEVALADFMELVEMELKTALFCTGHKNPQELRGNSEVLQWHNQ